MYVERADTYQIYLGRIEGEEKSDCPCDMKVCLTDMLYLVHSYVSVLLLWQLLSPSHTIMSLNFQEWSRDHRVEVKRKPSFYTDVVWGCSGRLVEASTCSRMHWMGMWGCCPCEEEREISKSKSIFPSRIGILLWLCHCSKLLQTGQLKQQVVMSNISGSCEVQDQGPCSLCLMRTLFLVHKWTSSYCSHGTDGWGISLWALLGHWSYSWDATLMT